MENARWSFLLGGRLDKHNLINNIIFSPRANIRYNPTSDINLRLSYSSGFRAPQAFDEDLHVTAMEGSVALIRLADNLKEEKSHSFSASADFYKSFGPVQTNFLIEGFYTDLRNVFVIDKIDEEEEDRPEDIEDSLTWERRNAKGATVMGINLEAKAVYSWIQVQAGATIQRSRYKEPNAWSEDEHYVPQKKMFRSPDVYGYFTSTFSPVKNFSAALTGTYTGSMLIQHNKGYIEYDRDEKTPSFFDMNVKLTYDIPVTKFVTMQVYGGVQNLFNSFQSDFDKDELRDSGYIYDPTLPRSYFIGCKFTY